MITVYRAGNRYSKDLGWLKTNLSFSFGDYYDPENTRFGPMRVCNDDTIGPGRGFGAHPHSDMEIVSIVLSGQLRHEDSLGNQAITGYGEVQRMSAGHGVLHTESNPSEVEPVRLLQLWFMPRERGLPPSYETSRFQPEEMRNALLPVVTPEGGPHAASISQDLIIYLSQTEAGTAVDFLQSADRRTFLYLIEGTLGVNGAETLHAGDSARFEGMRDLRLRATDDTCYMLIDLP